MASETPKFTTILHEVRLALGITLSEYCIADTIHKLSSNPKSKVPGWCYATKETLGSTIGITKQSIHTILNKLEKLDLIERDKETSNIRTTEKWYKILTISDSKETLPRVKKLDKNSKETLLQDSKETLPPIYEDNNNIDNNKDNSQPGGTPKGVEIEENDEIKLNKNIGTLIGIFEKVNPTPKSKSPNAYKIPSYRESATYLIEKLGFDRAKELCELAVSNSGTPYAPLVPNIYTMMLKMYEVVAWQERTAKEKANNHPKIVQGTDFSKESDDDYEKFCKERDERLAKISQKKEG